MQLFIRLQINIFIFDAYFSTVYTVVGQASNLMFGLAVRMHGVNVYLRLYIHVLHEYNVMTKTLHCSSAHCDFDITLHVKYSD